MQQIKAFGADLDQKDKKSQTPIFYAISGDKYDMVQYLISQGVSLTTKDSRGLSPTHWAKKSNKLQILELLLQNGGLEVTDQARIPKAAKSKPFVKKET